MKGDQGGFDDPEKKDNIISLPGNSSRRNRDAKRHPIHDELSNPSHWEQREETSTLQPGPSLADKLLRLSSFGMTEEEIRGLLEEEIEENEFTSRDVAIAIGRGRALGLAKMKEAQYQAAMQGKVSAQTNVLALLGTEESKKGGDVREFEVARRIIPSRKD